MASEKNRAAVTQIEKWAREAEPGAVHVYGVGKHGVLDVAIPEVAQEKAAAWRLHLAGAVLLTQRRLPDRSVAYRATRSRR